MSRAEDLKRKAEKIKSSQQPAPATESSPSASPEPRRSPQVRAKPVRRTVDLSPAHHAELDTWCSETARQLGKARVTGQDVLRTLVARLLTDETLARKIRTDLQNDQ